MGTRDERFVHSSLEVEMYLGHVLLVCMCIYRWAQQLGGSRHLIPLLSSAMSFTGTLRQPAAQVRHPVAVSRYNSEEKMLLTFYSSLSEKGDCWESTLLKYR